MVAVLVVIPGLPLAELHAWGRDVDGAWWGLASWNGPDHMRPTLPGLSFAGLPTPFRRGGADVVRQGDDLGMTIWPRTGVPGAQLLPALQSVHDRAGTVSSGPMGEPERLQAYLGWTEDAAWQLRSRLTAEDFVRLVRTPAYWTIVQSRASEGIARLINTEMGERVAALAEAIADVQRLVTRWPAEAIAIEQIAVPDTNVLMHRAFTLATVDWWSLAGHEGTDSGDLRLVITSLVVDELDGLKMRGHDKARSEATAVLRVIWTWFGEEPGRRISLLEESGRRVSVELLVDDAGHERMTRPDDELVARTRAIGDLRAGAAHLLTEDTGAALRARMAGVCAHRLDPPPKRKAPEAAQ